MNMLSLFAKDRHRLGVLAGKTGPRRSSTGTGRRNPKGTFQGQRYGSDVVYGL